MALSEAERTYQREWARKRRLDPEFRKKERENQKRYRDSPEGQVKIRERSKAWRERNPNKLHGYVLKRNFGLSVEAYHEMLEAQGGVCAICENIDATGRRLAVDHCHETGRIRGLLCTHCNTALGLVNDSVDTLRRMKEYLSQPTEPPKILEGRETRVQA